MDSRGVAERIWYGDDIIAGAARAVLAPLALLYRGVVATRGALYDAGVLRARTLALPAVSVGNLTVGGTGKTPAAAWIAAQLASQGASPAIVLRGYGGDEPLVHRELNPGIPVIVDPDRVAGVLRAAAAGATVAVLDDAFQHRRARRDADVVVVNADRWRGPRRLLPAGPWREPVSALYRPHARRAPRDVRDDVQGPQGPQGPREEREARRALGALGARTLAVVTRRAASREAAAAVVDELAGRAPQLPVASAALSLGDLHRVDGDDRQPLTVLAGARVLVVAGIGDPGALRAQLVAAGATVRMRAFGDHHRFTTRDVSGIVSQAAGADWLVCTLKDAVKLRSLWSRAAPPLWYVSQQFVVESGESAVQSLVAALLGALPDHPERTDRPVHLPPIDS